ncbi:MAG: manganese efflux pump, partial [Slackia sp.]|nr:manganese efflux pump [Slackia sp.]
ILGFIGGNMIKEGITALRHPEQDVCATNPPALTASVVLMQSVATSIDAFAVGVGLRAVNVDIALSGVVIALTTAACCVVALALGKRFGHVLGDRAQIIGGVVLVLIGLKSMFF